ncbi:OsmC family protein [Portibacter marinus]|uniref:OsmC family protein n=1 Tax=Portibacter marinus TaxID=2898660 RepID=UPI001F3CA412|nr:OsmC family protein [Portibacter marinus]
MTKVKMKRVNDKVHFRAWNTSGNIASMDGSPGIGGQGKGVRPMELLLMSMAGCSSIDIVTILQKMRQNLKNLDVEVEGFREEGAIPAVFTKIHIHYILSGDLKEAKVKEAIDMSLGKYCSVSKMLEKAAEITSSYEIV